MERKQSPSMLTCIFVGLFAVLFFSILCNGIITICVLGEKINEKVIGAFSVGTVFCSTFVGNYIAGRLQRGKYGTICGVIAASVLVLQISTNIIFFDGVFRGFLITLMSVLLGSGMSCAILAKSAGNKRRRQ